jgi:membrane protein
MEQLRLIKEFLMQRIWEVDIRKLPPWRARFISTLRIGYLIVRDIQSGELNIRAMSLVYTTLLSLVPLLAVSFSVLKGFGVHNELEPKLLDLLAPLGAHGKEITHQIINFVENIRAGVLGSLGLAILIYTVVSLLQKIERAFNYTWQVSENRSLARRFSDYLSVVLIGPVLIFSAMGLTASIKSSALFLHLLEVPVLGYLVQSTRVLVPYLLVVIAFTFIYVFVPNTKVKLKSAFVGAVIAGVLFETIGFGFATLVASSPRAVAIYSAFAALFLFIVWLYLNWLTLLIGASIAFYVQNPERRQREHRELRLSNRLKEKLALAVMVLVGRRFYNPQPELTLRELAEQLNMAADAIYPVVNCLIVNDLLVRTEHDPPQFLPAHAPERIELTRILQAIRQAEEDGIVNLKRLPQDQVIDATFEAYRQAADECFEGKTLRDLVVEDASAETSLSGQAAR